MTFIQYVSTYRDMAQPFTDFFYNYTGFYTNMTNYFQYPTLCAVWQTNILYLILMELYCGFSKVFPNVLGV